MPETKTKTKKSAIKKTVKKVKKKPLEKKTKEIAEKKARYFESTGRRKTAVARVRILAQGEKSFLVNDKPLEQYFKTFELQQTVISPIQKMSCSDKFRILVKVRGGGFNGQAEAIRHGLSKALVLFNSDFRKRLKKVGFLTRDPRMRERKKFGLKRARRAPQWAKR